MQYTTEFILPFEPAGTIPVVRVKQGDSSTRFLRITIVNNNDVYHPGAELTILFREEKPDGTGVITDSGIDDIELGRKLVVLNDDGSVTVELTDQMTSCPGYCKCDLVFIGISEELISTAPFILDVCRSPGISDTAVSSDDLRTLINALNNVWQAGIVTVPGTTASGYITIGTNWSGSGPYTTTATASGYTVTQHTAVTVLNDVNTITQLSNDGIISLNVVNTNGDLTAVAVGGTTSRSMQIPVYFTEIGAASYSNVQDGQVIAFDAESGEWVNRDPATYGYLTEQDVRTIVESYGYLTEAQIAQKISTMVEDYVNSLDANNVRY